jgi:hypothetical protein
MSTFSEVLKVIVSRSDVPEAMIFLFGAASAVTSKSPLATFSHP